MYIDISVFKTVNKRNYGKEHNHKHGRIYKCVIPTHVYMYTYTLFFLKIKKTSNNKSPNLLICIHSCSRYLNLTPQNHP